MRRSLYTALAAALVLVAVLLVTVTVRHAGEPVYRLPSIAIVTVAVASVICIAASVLLLTLPQPRLTVLTALAVFLLVFGLLAIFSIGLLLILLSAAVFFGLIRAASRATQRVLVTHIAAGTALALSLVVLTVVGSQSPMVECRSNSVSSHSREWWGGSRSSGSGTGSMTPDGRASGEIHIDGETYRYVCSGGTLLEFERTR